MDATSTSYSPKRGKIAGFLNSEKLVWPISMFGTAVGAGILFLPIQAGLQGLWPLIIIALLAAPLTYYPHLAFGRLALSSKNKAADFSGVLQEHFGAKASLVITLFYFLSLFPYVLVYGPSMTNTIDDILITQTGSSQLPRWQLSGIILLIMFAPTFFGLQYVLEAFKVLVFPLILVLFGISVYLIPHWSLSAISIGSMPSVGTIVDQVYRTLPIMVFALFYAPAIPLMAFVLRHTHGDKAEEVSDRTLKFSSIMLFAFMMFFVLSCVLATSPEQLALAKSQNITILSFLANTLDSPAISIVGPIITITAIYSSFLAFYLGSKEALTGFLKVASPELASFVGEKKISTVLFIFFFGTIWLVAIIELPLITAIGDLFAPFIAIILFLLPMYAIRTVPALAKYRGALTNIFVTVAGLVTVSAILRNFF